MLYILETSTFAPFEPDVLDKVLKSHSLPGVIFVLTLVVTRGGVAFVSPSSHDLVGVTLACDLDLCSAAAAAVTIGSAIDVQFVLIFREGGWK